MSGEDPGSAASAPDPDAGGDRPGAARRRPAAEARAGREGGDRPEPCLRCGVAIPARLMGCKGGHCPNCGHPYPHGDCSD